MRSDEIASAKTRLAATWAHEVERPDISRRLKGIWMTGEEWPSIKCHEWARALLTLPPDAEIVRVVDSTYNDGVLMLVRSREFPVAPDYQMVPEIRVNLHRNELGDVDGRRWYETTVKLGP